MIRYRLACKKSHEFEVWFPSSEACDKQIARKLVVCPACGSAEVAKALMAPNVVTSERKAKRARRAVASPPEARAGADMPVPADAPPAPAQVLTGPQREMLRKLKMIRDKILADAEYVGPSFADEARRIHHEEAPNRGIYGEASPSEVEELASEGIEVLPVPRLPEDHN